MEFTREQRMILMQAVWSEMGHYHDNIKDDRFIKEYCENRIKQLEELETILWNGDNK